MFILRRLRAGLAVLALSGMGLVLGQPAAVAVAEPNFQVPFKCGETVIAATFSGHSPANAVDFQRDGIKGMPVVASAKGTVSRVENEGDTSYGKWIEIDHGSGWTTRYAHLSSQDVSVGDDVKLGEKIGEAGDTGGVTGPHLHYEQISGGDDVKVTLNGVDVPYYDHTEFTSENNC